MMGQLSESLVRGEGFAVDASTIRADANRQRGVPGTANIDWGDPAVATRPVREYLSALDSEGASGAAPANISLTDPMALKIRCRPNTPHRKIARSIHEAARDVARRIGETSEYRQSGYDRKKVEMLFAHLKRILRFDRLRLRGLSGANDEFLLAATVQNLRKLAMLRAQGPPGHRISAPA